MDIENLYRVYSNHLRKLYGQKVYKLPVNIPCSCPNRDGSKGFGGCIFCGASGSGHELHSEAMSVTEQLQANRELIERKYNAHRFIAYYQSFSNTYLDFEAFKKYMLEGARFKDVVELSISTRPDCIEERQLEFLRSLKEEQGIGITLELGLQSVNEKTLEILNRRHTVDDFIESGKRIKDYGLGLCTHLITDLPWDSKDDVIRAGETLNAVGTDYLKVHSLYVEKGTQLEKMYNSGLTLLSGEEFIDRTISLLEVLNPNTVIERLIGRVPESDCVVSNWHQSWWKIRDQLIQEMIERQTYQGKLYRV